VARRGREPGLTLSHDGRSMDMRAWARELLDSMAGICEVLDHGNPGQPYANALATQAAKIEDVRLTPSARLMTELESTGESFFDLALRMSAMHKGYFLDLYAPNEDRLADFASQAEESLRRRREIEARETETFEEYVARYFAP
jgi:glutamate--cysteine ligase